MSQQKRQFTGKGTRALNQIARKEEKHRVPRPSFPSIFVARARAQLEHTTLVARIPARLVRGLELSPSTWNQAFLNISRCLSTCRLPAAILFPPIPPSRSGCVLLYVRTRLETTQRFTFISYVRKLRTRGRNATPCRMLRAR